MHPSSASLAAGLLTLCLSVPAGGQGVIPNPCIDDARRAETRFGIPADLLVAIVLTESHGHPFALHSNRSGAAVYPASHAEAAARLRRADGRVDTALDVGCGQLNLAAQLTRIRRPELALIPQYNLYWAAQILTEFYRMTGSWVAAVGHYNSPDPASQQRYICAVGTRFAAIAGVPAPGFPSCRPS